MELCVPARICKRWREGGRTTRILTLSKVLEKAQIKPAEFKTCWSTVKDTIPDNELFHLFDNACGQLNRSGKEYFVKDIMRRYKAKRETVRLRGIFAAACLFVCLLGRPTSSRLETY